VQTESSRRGTMPASACRLSTWWSPVRRLDYPQFLATISLYKMGFHAVPVAESKVC
jgi:hypothetical protein